MRFQLLTYEPYLTLLLSSDITYDLGTRGCLTSEEFRKRISEKVKNRYKGENIDYILFIVNERINELFFSTGVTKRAIDYKDYVRLFSKTLEFLTRELINGLKIKWLEEFKFVTLYVEPNIILIKSLKDEQKDFVIYRREYQELLDFFLERRYPYIDLHVHAETSYSFKNLLETIISYYDRIFSDFVKLDKEKTGSVANVRKVNSIVEAFISLTEGRTGKEILRRVLLRSKLLNPTGTYNLYLLRFFNYDEFILSLLKNIDSSSDENIALASVFTIQTINQLHSSLAFIGEYKGLKQMSINFGHTLKKIYQKKREKLFKRKGDPIIEKTYCPYTSDSDNDRDNNYIEIRFSPEEASLRYWHEKTKSKDSKNQRSNIFFILHYQKVNEAKDFIDYRKLTSFLLEQVQLTEKLFHFLQRDSSRKIAERIVGFDAASIEYWTPAWMYRVLFKFWSLVFKFSFNKILLLTYHAGEDFIDLPTGLRNVYEAVYFLKVHRLGHAMSLGVDVDRYLYRYHRIVMNPVFYFYHLLWLHHLTFRFKEISHYRLLILRELSRFITKYDLSDIFIDYTIGNYLLRKSNNEESRTYLGNSSIYMDEQSLFFESLYENLGFFEFLFNRSLRKGLFYNILNQAHRLLFSDPGVSRYLSRIIKEVHRRLSRGKRTFENISPILSSESSLSSEEQLNLLKLIQQVIKQFIKQEEVVIETCPSSNIILYNIKSFSDHPLLKDEDELILTINTDNPLLVSTNIQLEYAIVKEIFKEEKVKNFIKNAKKKGGKFLFSFEG